MPGVARWRMHCSAVVAGAFAAAAPAVRRRARWRQHLARGFLFLSAPLLALPSLLLVPLPAHAQLFVDGDSINRQLGEHQTAIDDIKEILRELNQRLSALETQNQNLRQQVQQSLTLSDELRTLRGRIEVLENNSPPPGGFDALQGQVQTLGDGLQARDEELQILNEVMQARSEEFAALKEQVEQLTRVAATVAPPDEGALYGTAFSAYQSSDYAQAVEQFTTLVDFYPDGQFVINARYWIGQSHFALGDYDAALDAAQTLLVDYPASDRQADTMLLAARAHIGLGQTELATQQLEEILAQHPTSLAADQSREILAR